MILSTLFCMALCMCIASKIYSKTYDRNDFRFKSYKVNVSTGFYTGLNCKIIVIDHVVSLRDAYYSGADKWSFSKKIKFANDKENHVPACQSINSSKGANDPKGFLSLSRDNKGLDYKIIRWCDYVKIYHSVKIKYELDIDPRNNAILEGCGILI